jgi:Aspartyl protease
VKRRKFIVKKRLKGRKVRILIDSESNLNCVSEKFMKRVGLPKRKSKKGILIRTIDGGDIERVEWKTVLSLKMKEVEESWLKQEVLDIANVSNDVILGNK